MSSCISGLCAGLLALIAVDGRSQPLSPSVPTQDFSYSVYVDMARAHVEQQGERDLLQRLTTRDPQGLLIRFPPGSEARVSVHLKSGVLRYAADDRDEVHLPDKREWRRDNPRIVLSVRPVELALDF